MITRCLPKCGPQFGEGTIDHFVYVSFQGAKIIVVSLLHLRPHRPEAGAQFQPYVLPLLGAQLAGFLAVCQLAQKLGKPHLLCSIACNIKFCFLDSCEDQKGRVRFCLTGLLNEVCSKSDRGKTPKVSDALCVLSTSFVCL